MCCGEDQLLENCADNLPFLASQFATCGFAAVSGIAFSVYYCDPPLESLMNVKRNLWSLSVIENAGVRTFPMISWRYEADIQRWAEWLSGNSLVQLVGVDFQDCKTSADWGTVMEGFRVLVALSPPTVRFLLHGVAAPWKIRRLNEVTSRIHITNEQPFLKATKGREPPNMRQHSLWPRDRHELFRAWLEYYDNLCQSATIATAA